MMDAHLKNLEKFSFGGKFDPYAGLATSGIAGTGPYKDKEDEESKVPGAAGTAGTGAPATPGSTDVEMKDGSKKDDENSSQEDDAKTSDSNAAAGCDQQKSEAVAEADKGKDKEGPSELAKENGDPKVFNEGNLQSAAAAVKAKHLAAVEEKKFKSLVALLVETQMKKLEQAHQRFLLEQGQWQQPAIGGAPAAGVTPPQQPPQGPP
ncbi:SWI/SNF complex subunit SMARCC2-like [Ochlerotatus camptorhynchus]|uniref:SWI/SNF complex subunit SMARCC2-like n=1 Tax=Ochlerotatus camptorhynchus TaxID=644619 RepID=UPI0031D3C626